MLRRFKIRENHKDSVSRLLNSNYDLKALKQQLEDLRNGLNQFVRYGSVEAFYIDGYCSRCPLSCTTGLSLLIHEPYQDPYEQSYRPAYYQLLDNNKFSRYIHVGDYLSAGDIFIPINIQRLDDFINYLDGIIKKRQ